MKLKYQVCSFQLATELADLGLTVNAYFFWATSHLANGEAPVVELAMAHATKGMYVPDMLGPNEGGTSSCDETVNAYTSSEMGAMLPPRYHTRRLGQWSWECVDDYGYPMFEDLTFPTEVEAKAQMLRDLLMSGKMTADEANERLTNTSLAA